MTCSLMNDFNNCYALLSLIPKEQIDRVFNQKECDIDIEFLGFIDIYKKLSEIIPKHFTIVDLGCAYNPQCFYFKDHKKYIAVDLYTKERFQAENCELINKSICEYIKNDISDLNLDETFAICSYVPDWHDNNIEMVRKTFKNVFTYYPHGGEIVRIYNNA